MRLKDSSYVQRKRHSTKQSSKAQRRLGKSVKSSGKRGRASTATVGNSPEFRKGPAASRGPLHAQSPFATGGDRRM
ncbi:hypothetical protein V5799_034261 [Amblyomma americanum]|uniref:Uncharacterized protein n=1 Tax=Amblyomma americanum TaxID=6943 RepID=A0AAQ4DKZ4_AMBAM